MKIIMYATTKEGDGFVSQVGEYEDWEEISIRCGMFADDVVITFSIENDEKDTE